MNIPETFFSVREELILLGISFLSGAVIGVFYDVFRALRVIFPHNSALVAIEDIIFLCSYGIFFLAFSSALSRGQPRFCYVLGNIVGFALYYALIGNFMIKALRDIFEIIKKFVKIIFKPVTKLWRHTVKILSAKTSKKSLKNSENFVEPVKKRKLLLLKRTDLLYNIRENNKKGNVTDIAEEVKEKKDKKAEKACQERSF